MSNCTQCHVLGEKVTNEKCLACHSEMKRLISNNKGYHVSAEVKGKDCFACHSEHHGLNFKLIRFDEKTFNHKLTGYQLEGKHRTISCAECHQAKNITVKTSKKKSGSFLGLAQNCLSCHADYHRQSLPSDCSSCHGFDAFSPASKFSHENTAFALKGKHRALACEKCHPNSEVNGSPFQKFTGLKFNNCTACHTDVHQNKFGQNCRSCHNENSFRQVAGMANFDHGKTAFPLQGKHSQLSCQACHKQSFATALAHGKCIDCHSDYHRGQFDRQTQKTDCSTCHDVNGFQTSNFTIELHNQSRFKLEDAHLATPCFACHQKEKRWEFRQIGEHCVDCHPNIHLGKIGDKYMPQQDCRMCHGVSQWADVTFDHKLTGFNLTGKHADTSCRACHFKQEGDRLQQQFAGMGKACQQCHADVHRGQFGQQGQTDCSTCHEPGQWSPSNFDHNRSRFKLDGQHARVACIKCHPPTADAAGTFVRYKLNQDIKCANCHH